MFDVKDQKCTLTHKSEYGKHAWTTLTQHKHTHIAHICSSPLEIHKDLMIVSWVTVCLTLLTSLSYCHTSHRTLTVAWRWGDNSACVCACVCKDISTWEFKHACGLTFLSYSGVHVVCSIWNVIGCVCPIRVRTCKGASVRVFTMDVKCLSGPISHLPSTQMNWRAAKSNRHEDGAEGITMQLSVAVCPDPVWGPSPLRRF